MALIDEVLWLVRRDCFRKDGAPPDEGVLGLTVANYLCFDRRRIFRVLWVALVYAELDQEAAEIRSKFMQGDEQWWKAA